MPVGAAASLTGCGKPAFEETPSLRPEGYEISTLFTLRERS